MCCPTHRGGKSESQLLARNEAIFLSCRYQQLLASCSNITYHKYNENGNTGYIEATDCVNGTWFQNGEMARVDYETLLVNYERYRTDRSRMVVSSSADQVSLIPWEEDITILNDVSWC